MLCCHVDPCDALGQIIASGLGSVAFRMRTVDSDKRWCLRLGWNEGSLPGIWEYPKIQRPLLGYYKDSDKIGWVWAVFKIMVSFGVP